MSKKRQRTLACVLKNGQYLLTRYNNNKACYVEMECLDFVAVMAVDGEKFQGIFLRENEEIVLFKTPLTKSQNGTLQRPDFISADKKRFAFWCGEARLLVISFNEDGSNYQQVVTRFSVGATGVCYNLFEDEVILQKTEE